MSFFFTFSSVRQVTVNICTEAEAHRYRYRYRGNTEREEEEEEGTIEHMVRREETTAE